MSESGPPIPEVENGLTMEENALLKILIDARVDFPRGISYEDLARILFEDVTASEREEMEQKLHDALSALERRGIIKKSEARYSIILN